MDANILENIRAHIVAYRDRHDITVKQLAKQCDINEVTLWDVRTGRKNRKQDYTLETLSKIAQGLGITLIDLLGTKP